MDASPKKARDIFLTAIKLPADEREGYVQEACGDDQDLHRRMSALLQAQAELGSFHEATAHTVEQPIIESSDTAIGPYKLLEQIGEGGMGTVWMAQQAEPVRRVVALKLIKAGMDSKQVIARFEAERQALALMDHPNIAKVLDADTTAAGRPYFVMDLVKGVPITKYCDEHHLTPQQRLELFIPICQAVQHAHQKGIIHRDLKPSNVLVALYDGKPVPKVIDFGVAKAAGQSLTDKTLVTGLGAILGTLEYMSPEQAEINQLDIDTRSDIYSLGVLLYELLAGSPPFSRKELEKAGVLEMLRVIREQEPSKPSTRLSTAEGLPTLAANRSTEPTRLTKLVRGELDWIVMKALEKDRNRRYETANGFAADMQRYLDDEPVQACPPSAIYRLKKVVRRNKGLVVAAVVVLLTLVGGIIGTSVGFVQAEAARQAETERAAGERLAREQAQRERDAKESARQKEEQERKYAQAIADFVKYDFFALTSVEGQARFGGTSDGQLDKDTTLRQLLDRAAAKLNQRTDLDQRIEAELRWMIGVNYRSLGEPGLAIPFLERCVTIRTELFGPGQEETLNAQNSLAVALQADRKLALALPLFENTFELRKAQLGADHPNTLLSMNNLAMAYLAAGNLGLALPFSEDTLKLAEAKLGVRDPLTLKCMNNLARIYRAAGKFDLALPLHEDALKLHRANLGSDHPQTLESMNNVAVVYGDVGRIDDAIALLEEALKLWRAKLGPTHSYTLDVMNNLCSAFLEAGRLTEAIALAEETLNLCKANLGCAHHQTIESMAKLASAYDDAQRFAEAELLLWEVIAIQRRDVSMDSPALASTLALLGRALLMQRKYDEAEPILRECLTIRERKQPNVWRTFATKSLLGASLLGQKRYAEAEPMLVAGYEGLRDPEKTTRAWAKLRLTEALERLVQLYEAWDKEEKADEWRRELDAHTRP